VLDLRQIWSNLSAKPTEEVNLLFHNYLIALGTGNENTTRYNTWGFKENISNYRNLTSAINVTGEIHSPLKWGRMKVRGSIVIGYSWDKAWTMKGSKSRLTLSRAYVTSNKKSNSSQSLMNENCENNLGFERIARLWISNYKKPTRKYKSLKTILNTKELWYASYIKVRSSRGSETPGVDLQTLDGTTKGKLDLLRERVIERKFNWKPIKRVEIPKDKGKTRPLGIPTLNDRIVQEVLRTILEPIYETTFSNRSHGFRPGYSCHTALKYVNTQFKAVSWYIEGDISKYFDTINHNILLHLLKRKVRDNLILNLIESGLKADVIFNEKRIEHISGTPQGGILSPLLSNIYLNELDKYIESIELEYLGPSKRPKANPAYSKIMNKARKDWNPKKARKLKINKSEPFDPLYRHIRYVRYADDFLIGIAGPRKLAIEIRERIRVFLETKLSLKLNLEKTKITNISRKIPFLGYQIGRRIILTKQRYGGAKRWVTRKMIIPTLDGNIDKMINNLARNNFCDKSGFSKPNFSLLMLPQSEINARINSVILGISNWWSIAGNRRRGIARISYILRFSAAKLYAAKFKLDSISKVFKRGGKGLNRPLSSNKSSVVGVTDEWISNWFKPSDLNSVSVRGNNRIIRPILYSKYKDIPKNLGNKLKPDWKPEFVKDLSDENGILKLIEAMKQNKLTSTDRNPLSLLGWRMSKGIKVFGEPCFICGSTNNVEMHHVKSLKDLKPLKNMIKDRQRAILRKQIPLCKMHHLQIHNYNWRNSAISIKRLKSLQNVVIKPNDDDVIN
jgi:group II intron reverse transcriptase/maturase